MANNIEEVRNPFTGISPYSDNSEYILRGRDSETWQLYNRILRNNYTVYYAESGEGKSSLIKAGLFPLIRMKNYFPIYITLMEDDFKSEKFCIYDRIAKAITEWNERHEGEAIECFIGETSEPDKVRSLFTKSEWHALRVCYFKKKNRFTKEWEKDVLTNEEKLLIPIFVFDQFEEVFTKGDFKWTELFMFWLGKIMSDMPPEMLKDDVLPTDLRNNLSEHFRILFSMRTEYLGELDYWCAQRYIIPQLQDNRLCLKPLTLKGAKEVIGLSENLKIYETEIIKGCIPKYENPASDETPCVYALILSVVCHYLYEKDQEREDLLKELRENAEKAVDTILYNFYTESLRSVGIKNESLMEKFDEVFVDSRGKRRRQTMGENSDVDIFEEWIFIPACNDEKGKEKSLISCGLIKTQGKVQGKDQKEYLIVELPHDRLCEAVNTFRNKRKERLEEKNRRLKEWIQLGIISSILGIVSLCVWWLVSLGDSSIESLINSLYNPHVKIGELFVKYLDNKPALLENKDSLDEGFSTCLLLAFYAIVFPLVVNFWSKTGKIGKIGGVITSFFGFCAFILLIKRSYSIHFSYVVLYWMMWIGAAICFAVLLRELWELIKYRGKNKGIEEKGSSSWPLFGGFFLFCLAIMIIITYNETYGSSTPNDTYWALILLPLLSCAFTWGFMKLKVKDNRRKVKITLSCFLIVVLTTISSLLVIPKTVGFIPVSFSTSCIVLILMFIITVLWMFMSDSMNKCFRGILANGIILLLIYCFNLGYNPFNVRPNSVVCVYSWKTVVVKNTEDPITQANCLKMKLGVVYWDGDTILPCRIKVDKTMLHDGLFPNNMACIRSSVSFSSNPIMGGSMFNTDSSFEYVNGHVYGKFMSFAFLDNYFRTTKEKGLKKGMQIQDSINYYAAMLFLEIREANLHYVDSAKAYTMNDLPSYQELERLQSIAWLEECHRLNTDSLESTNKNRNYIDVLTDASLVNFHRELARRFLLLQLKDRVEHEDFPNVFTLASTYPMVFFHNLSGVRMSHSFSANFNTGTELFKTKTFVTNNDVTKGRLFAWYYIFNNLCSADIAYNYPVYEKLKRNKIGEFDAGYSTLMEEMLSMVKNSYFTAYIKDNKSKSFVNSLKEYIDRNKNNEWSKSKMEQALVLIDKYKEAGTDSVFEEFENQVFGCLIPVMLNCPSNIYYNDFETICKNMIQVATIRGLKIDDNTKKIDSCDHNRFVVYKSIKDLEIKYNEIADEVNKRFNMIISAYENNLCK